MWKGQPHRCQIVAANDEICPLHSLSYLVVCACVSILEYMSGCIGTCVQARAGLLAMRTMRVAACMRECACVCEIVAQGQQDGMGAHSTL